MSENKFIIEELKRQYREAENNFNIISEKLYQARQEEYKIKQEKLKAEKETRKKEVEAALEKYYKLKEEFIRDYGYYSTSTSGSFEDMDTVIETLVKFWWS